MACLSVYFKYVIFLAFVISGQGALYYEYPEVRMEQFCDTIVTLPCPDSDSSTGRAGKLHFWIVPLENCSVNVQTALGCNTQHALYFNIPRSDLAMEDFLEVYEKRQPGGRGTLIKRIPGGSSPRGREPKSVAQLLTSASKQQSLNFYLYIEPKTYRNYSHEVVFDYTVVKSQNGTSETYCGALNGYVHSDIICTEDGDDRLNCPVSYFASIGIENRGFRQQACIPSTRVGTTRRGYYGTFANGITEGSTTTQRYADTAQAQHIDRTSAELKSLSIAGLFLMLVIGVLLASVIVLLIMRMTGKSLPFVGLRKQRNGDPNGDTNPLWNPNESSKL